MNTIHLRGFANWFTDGIYRGVELPLPREEKQMGIHTLGSQNAHLFVTPPRSSLLAYLPAMIRSSRLLCSSGERSPPSIVIHPS